MKIDDINISIINHLRDGRAPFKKIAESLSLLGTPAGNAIYGIKARDVVIFSPHPRTLKTSRKTVELMREGLRRVGAPEDLVQILGYKAKINKGISEALMTKVDLIIATGGQGVVRRAYMSGTPAFAVGAKPCVGEGQRIAQ